MFYHVAELPSFLSNKIYYVLLFYSYDNGHLGHFHPEKCCYECAYAMFETLYQFLWVYTKRNGIAGSCGKCF